MFLLASGQVVCNYDTPGAKHLQTGLRRLNRGRFVYSFNSDTSWSSCESLKESLHAHFRLIYRDWYIRLIYNFINGIMAIHTCTQRWHTRRPGIIKRLPHHSHLHYTFFYSYSRTYIYIYTFFFNNTAYNYYPIFNNISNMLYIFIYTKYHL